MKSLKIYFTSDVHGYLYPTDYLDDKRKPIGLLNVINSFNKDENTLIIDCGDTIQGSPFTTYLNMDKHYDVNPIAKVMNEGKYDYITLGNHDFNYGYDYLKKYVNNLNGKCLCANIEDKTNKIKILPYDIKIMGNGLKVGLIGFTTDYVTRWEKEEHIKNFKVKNTFEAIKNLSEELKSSVDILVGFYHGGFEYDLSTHKKLSHTTENIAYKICEELNFDILLTGHQHMQIAGELLNGTYIVQTPNFAKKYIEINLEFNKGIISNITSELKVPSINPNEKMYREFLPFENKVESWLSSPVGHLDVKLKAGKHIDMALKGSYLANFINEVQLSISGADISCTSFANKIKGFNKDVTVRDIVSTYIYPNTLVVLEVAGKVLKEALERCASYFHIEDNNTVMVSKKFLKPKIEHYNYDYFSNIQYEFDIRKEVGERVVSMKFKGNEVEDSQCLTLVMNNYRASGSGGYEFYRQCKIVKEISLEMPEIIINYFSKHKRVIVDKNKYLEIKF